MSGQLDILDLVAAGECQGCTWEGPVWLDQHAAKHPASWPDTRGPILTQRGPHATRHVPGGSPWGGYDVAADHIEETPC